MGAFSKVVKNLFEDFGQIYRSNKEGSEGTFAVAPSNDPVNFENLSKKYKMDVPPKLSDLTSFRNTKLFKDVSESVKSDINQKLGTDPSGLMPDQSVVDDAAAEIFDEETFGDFVNSDYWDSLKASEVVDIASDLKKNYNLDDIDVNNYLEMFGASNSEKVSDVLSMMRLED
tara:strand:+ start:1645 stop:2160 length:516 start_codon:yes stop_codon:yes gene_type:complete